MTSEIPAPKDAATVLILRDGQDDFEVFMVRRHGRSGFMAGAHVFPGGKVDAADSSPEMLALCQGHSEESAREALSEGDVAAPLGLFVAALRETFEEAGILLADGIDPGELEGARKALHDGEGFASILERFAMTLRLDAAIPQARWITPIVEKRRYDTRFFLAKAPADHDASHDAIETTAGEWLSPKAALAAAEAGRIVLPPPTLKTIQWLAAFPSADEAIAAARSQQTPELQPVFHNQEGTLILSLPGDELHPVSEAALPGATRIVLEDGRWWTKDAD